MGYVAGGFTNQMNSSYIDSMRKAYAWEKKIRSMYGYTDKDYVTIHVLPNGQKSKRFASFNYKPLTPRAKRLQSQIYSIRGQITKTEHAALSPKEKAKRLHNLRCQLKYASGQYSCEMANAPKVGCIVLEESEVPE